MTETQFCSTFSQLLNTQLDRETLATCVGMIEGGVNPEALAVGRYYPDRQAETQGKHILGGYSGATARAHVLRAQDEKATQ